MATIASAIVIANVRIVDSGQRRGKRRVFGEVRTCDKYYIVPQGKTWVPQSKTWVPQGKTWVPPEQEAETEKLTLIT